MYRREGLIGKRKEVGDIIDCLLVGDSRSKSTLSVSNGIAE